MRASKEFIAKDTRVAEKKMHESVKAYVNPIPHGMCRPHNFVGGGGHIDPTTFEALWGPSYAP